MRVLSLAFSVFCLSLGVVSAAEDVAKTKGANQPKDEKLIAQEIEKSIARGVKYLLDHQNPDGSWGSARNTKGLNIYCPPPGGHIAFHVASTSLCICGLIDSGDKSPEVKKAIQKAEQFLFTKFDKLKRADGTTTYNNWGHAYGLKALVAMSSYFAADEGIEQRKKKYKKFAQMQLERLHAYQDLDGGWGYLNLEAVTNRPCGGSMSFCTSTVLLALAEAEKTFGLKYDPKRKKEAVRSIHQQRYPDFSYSYSMELRLYARESINRPAGSQARTVVCNAALYQCGDKVITPKVLTAGVERFVRLNGWLDIGRKRPRPHETHYGISGYFYLYGHYYAAQCVSLLPKEKTVHLKKQLATILLSKQDKDGSWWDYMLYDYHKAYGTGYTLSALARLR